MPLLDHIKSPADIKGLSIGELRELCAEIRSYMVECCAVNPGHLASSLGAVELIVGIHYVFDTPDDKVIFDVGHQAYAHKILTGRMEAFKQNRKAGGLSGFPKISESPYDAFGTGHSSTSISAALGFAEAARLNGSSSHSVAFIGDGALTGGMAFEALNNAGASKSNLLIVLNDNNQSIDDNLGGLHENLLRITTSRKYNSLKHHVWTRLGEKRFRNILQNWIRSIKFTIVKKSGGDLFEALGLRYFGPIDGNDIEQVVVTLRKLREIGGPRVIHCYTTKGKGYAPAEADPTVWHAPGRFNSTTGERIAGDYTADRYQDVFGETLCKLSDLDDKVLGITPAMASGCGMNKLAAYKPSRFFDVGIEEEHAVTFSAGLAAAGMKPFCNIYSAFSQRAYDQIVHDVALQRLPVVLCFDRAGLVGEDGATHQGMFDMAAYRSIPNTIISSPRNEMELKNLMFTAYKCECGPFIIRYPRGAGEGVKWKDGDFCEYPLGKAEILMEGSDLAIIATGPCVNRALEAAEKFSGKVGVFNFRFLKPLDTEMMDHIAEHYKHVLTLEDGCLKGGLFGAVSEYFAETGKTMRISASGVGDLFVEQGRQIDQRHEVGIDTEGIIKKIEKIL